MDKKTNSALSNLCHSRESGNLDSSVKLGNDKWLQIASPATAWPSRNDILNTYIDESTAKRAVDDAKEFVEGTLKYLEPFMKEK